LGRTFTGWIAPAYGWRTLFDHRVGVVRKPISKFCHERQLGKRRHGEVEEDMQPE